MCCIRKLNIWPTLAHQRYCVLFADWECDHKVCMTFAASVLCTDVKRSANSRRQDGALVNHTAPLP